MVELWRAQFCQFGGCCNSGALCVLPVVVLPGLPLEFVRVGGGVWWISAPVGALPYWRSGGAPIFVPTTARCTVLREQFSIMDSLVAAVVEGKLIYSSELENFLEAWTRTLPGVDLLYAREEH